METTPAPTNVIVLRAARDLSHTQEWPTQQADPMGPKTPIQKTKRGCAQTYQTLDKSTTTNAHMQCCTVTPVVTSPPDTQMQPPPHARTCTSPHRSPAPASHSHAVPAGHTTDPSNNTEANGDVLIGAEKTFILLSAAHIITLRRGFPDPLFFSFPCLTDEAKSVDSSLLLTAEQ